MLAGEDKTDVLVTWRFSMKRSRNSPVQHMEPIPALLFRRDAKNEGNHSVKRPCFTVMAASISGRGRWSNWNWSTEFGHVGSPLRQRWGIKHARLNVVPSHEEYRAVHVNDFKECKCARADGRQVPEVGSQIAEL
jgi:hypothetical protein